MSRDPIWDSLQISSEYLRTKAKWLAQDRNLHSSSLVFFRDAGNCKGASAHCPQLSNGVEKERRIYPAGHGNFSAQPDKSGIPGAVRGCALIVTGCILVIDYIFLVTYYCIHIVKVMI